MRKIISLSSDGRWAVADDGTVWFWDGVKWVGDMRPPLPEPPAPDDFSTPAPMSIERRARIEKKGPR